MFRVIKYLLSNSINSIRNDCKEYKALQKNYKDLKAKKDMAYKELREIGACLSYEKIVEKYWLVIDNGHPLVPEDIPVECENIYYIPCKSFSPVTLCKKSDCPNFAKNLAYIDAYNLYRNARISKETFWKDKFAKRAK